MHKSINAEYFQKVELKDGTIAMTAELYSVSLARKIRVVRVPMNKTHKLFFSTDLEMDPATLVQYYQLRFQIEFVYRDGKQYTGLENCQARSENKLDFHFNMALTAINIAKVAHWLKIPKDLCGSFSMADVKTMNHNALLIDRIISKFGINPNLNKNKEIVN